MKTIQSSTITTFIAFLLLFLIATPIPKRLGLYQYLFSFHPAFIGLYPWTISNEDQWGFSSKELYQYNDNEQHNQNRLHGQTAIVTGANSGIGYEISLALVRLGATVTMACRNPSKCDAAAVKIRKDIAANDNIVVENKSRKDNKGVGKVRTMTVNMSSLNSVQKFCIDYYQQQVQNENDDNDNDNNNDQLIPDMLFFNAGIKYSDVKDDGSLLSLSEDGIEQIFATNVVGHHLMYKLLVEQPIMMNTLRQSQSQRTRTRTTTRRPSIRIVSTSSAVSYLNTFPYKVATNLGTLNSVSNPRDPNLYHQSKLAQILWTKELTSRTLDTGTETETDDNDNNNSYSIYANSANPGAVATKIWEDTSSSTGYNNLFWSLFHKLHQLFMWTSEEAALTLLYLGTAVEDLQQQNIRGKYFHPQTKLMEKENEHQLFAKDNESNTKFLQVDLWKFLDELVADFV